ncbi:hypothetical protein ACFZAR_36805 [Streptomyces sp. NPDC008222]|uniref:hypothetical protein n=1 Tax=Streptomyces sp. NPDC008222 TaxID=3364820 RepID=UPI0036E9478A
MQVVPAFAAVGTDLTALQARKVVENQTLKTDHGAREHEARLRLRDAQAEAAANVIPPRARRRPPANPRPLPDLATYDRQSKPTTRTVNQKDTSA